MELIGIVNKSIKEVTREDLATTYESGSLEVFATPALVKEMERTANESIKGKLKKGSTSVGIRILVKHIKPSKIGAQIETVSKVTNVEGNKIFFEIESFENGKKIGLAEHTRFIVNEIEFMK